MNKMYFQGKNNINQCYLKNVEIKIKKKYMNEFYMLFFEIMMFLFGDKKNN
jgi:hypothetical protein